MLTFLSIERIQETFIEHTLKTNKPLKARDLLSSSNTSQSIANSRDFQTEIRNGKKSF